MFHSVTLQKFKFTFFNINTGPNWIEELRHRPLKNENKENTEDSFMYIWQCLNKNQRLITQFIAERELENTKQDEQNRSHYTFSELLDKCIDEIVLGSDHHLRQNLLELLDHKVIREKIESKGGGKKNYWMAYEKQLLEKILTLKVE